MVRIQRTTITSVALLAIIAAIVSFRHMHELCLRHGEDGFAAVLIPLAVDGTIVTASMSILLANRSGSRGDVFEWALPVISSLASLGANIAVAEPTMIGRIIAAWPSAALIGSYELFMCQVRRCAPQAQTATDAVTALELGEDGGEDPPDQVQMSVERSRRVTKPADAIELHRAAWRWTQANRRPDGALLSGKAIAAQFSRSARWGR
ncbi:DUF2637 domain-containing protein [Streptosporangiaceae bacterium NEAU-GS5]|nr:DUF2637 domain-containing protein [Streptosporangiaceae bacterium NEAU-GS5]